jgi:hypothetical protein
MKVLNLCCASSHRFEGWFASEDDYHAQIERGLIACPVCGDTTVQRLPSAPHVLSSASRALVESKDARSAAQAQAPPASGTSTAVAVTDAEPVSRDLAMQAAWLQAVAHVVANTVDVGPRFAEEARRIHYGEAEERAIRGQATHEEARALHDEGVEVVAFALPEALKGPLQ